MERKRNACAECYRLKKTCTYLVNEKDGSKKGSCERCLRLGRPCIPRVVIRSHKKIISPRNSSVSDLHAFQSLSLTDENKAMSEHFGAASVLCKSFQQLGLKEAPRFLQLFTRVLFLLAKRLRSVSRLHAATCLALSTGTNVDLAWLETENIGPDPKVLNDITSEIIESYLNHPKSGSCIILRHRAGFREVFTSSQFTTFFEPAEVVAKHAGDSSKTPHIEIPAKYITNAVDHQSFFGRTVKCAMGSSVTVSVNGHTCLHWSNSEEGVNIIDNQGNPYTATLFEAGYFAEDGLIAFFIFAFRDMRPLNDISALRLEHFNPSYHQNERFEIPSSSYPSDTEEVQSISTDDSGAYYDAEIANPQGAPPDFGMVNPNSVDVWESMNRILDASHDYTTSAYHWNP